MPWRWLALTGVVTVCLAYLVFSATSGTAEYYQTIAEVRSHPAGGSVRVLGTVQDGVSRSESGAEIRFTAADRGQMMPVVYRGTLPDTFKPGTQVVVEGTMAPDGVFHATTLQGKCPSRFSSAKARGTLTG
jgi:cytochrome c-type biogenesis protein CcmE